MMVAAPPTHAVCCIHRRISPYVSTRARASTARCQGVSCLLARGCGAQGSWPQDRAGWPKCFSIDTDSRRACAGDPCLGLAVQATGSSRRSPSVSAKGRRIGLPSRGKPARPLSSDHRRCGLLPPKRLFCACEELPPQRVCGASVSFQSWGPNPRSTLPPFCCPCPRAHP